MAQPLSEQYGGIRGSHPDWPVDQWQAEVAEDDTRLGYWDWVVFMIESKEEFEAEQDGGQNG